MSLTRYRFSTPQAIAALSLLAVALVQPAGNASSREFMLKSGARGKHTVFNGNLKRAAGLNGFGFNFNGHDDHEIRSIGLLQAPGKATATYQDQDGKEAYNFFGKYVHLANADLHQAARNDCRGSCTLPIPRETDKVFILAGFEVSNRRGEDRNLRQLSVVPELAAGRVRVTFTDNSGFDFATRVQYLVLPKSAVLSEESYSLTERRRSTKARRPGTRVLESFSFQFLNGDHHLNAIGVQAGALVFMGMNDRNYDDPVRAEARFAVLR